MKMIAIEDSGFVWHLPLAAVAAARAAYYVEKDAETTYEEEFDYVMADGFEGIDWLQNNMNFSEVRDKAVLVQSPDPLDEPGSDAKYSIEEIA